eukprot:5245787-Prymnesium_polylepis.1
MHHKRIVRLGSQQPTVRTQALPAHAQTTCDTSAGLIGVVRREQPAWTSAVSGNGGGRGVTG